MNNIYTSDSNIAWNFNVLESDDKIINGIDHCIVGIKSQGRYLYQYGKGMFNVPTIAAFSNVNRLSNGISQVNANSNCNAFVYNVKDKIIQLKSL